MIPFFGKMLVSEIRNQHVREFISKRLREGDKKSTINRYTKTLTGKFSICSSSGAQRCPGTTSYLARLDIRPAFEPYVVAGSAGAGSG